MSSVRGGDTATDAPKRIRTAMREGVKTVARQSLGTWKRVEKKGSNNAERNEGIASRVDVTVEVRG
ncbi:hypothetical protein PHLCEN_2v7115 [Hermanssonia centrifuga]|uniref:Uncharacterized protein n=1 Tax=Hermanssonia centrifuga TaxID=98765 RepID=A0A2R6NXI8_9APHY|nr:hypothetical protein PHLCEN_2v7115 [Hermanssonia centrifuga]